MVEQGKARPVKEHRDRYRMKREVGRRWHESVHRILVTTITQDGHREFLYCERENAPKPLAVALEQFRRHSFATFEVPRHFKIHDCFKAEWTSEETIPARQA